MPPNRLINEKSPYLRQHASNPVDWYPWCKEAFEKAKLENKPIFLSIGYSSCHWCHVMEKESFEDHEIAEILNRFFVSIKVDREERPDIDSIYMKVCYLFQNRGGWPLTVFLTPDKKPFYVDTYIPKDDSYGKMGLRTLLLRIVEIWNENKEKVDEISREVTEALVKTTKRQEDKSELSENLLHQAYKELKNSFDIKNKGFGTMPKFPMPLNMLFLHRYYFRYREQYALDMSLQTLKKIRQGGIFDHLGFGFHRYSTDGEWILPHFEKMLYDNALLMLAYSEAYQLSKDPFYRKVVDEIADYLITDMYSPDGGFYSALDADSDGKEGEFYLWSYDELKSVMDSEEFEFFTMLFNISKEGNFHEEATKQKTGKNILYMTESFEEISKKLKISEDDLHERFNRIRMKLLDVRKKRIKPLRDEKILTDWNSLVALSFCRAGISLSREEYIKIAEKCMNFIFTNLYDGRGRLFHRFSHGETAIPGFIEDYAYTIWALLELYFSIFDERYLSRADILTNHVIKHFLDNEEGGFYQTADYSETVLFRVKERYDGVTPSGNSVMLHNLIRLSRIIGLSEYEKIAKKCLQYFASEITSYPLMHLFSLVAFDLILNGFTELKVIADHSKLQSEKDFLKEIQKEFIPNLLPQINDFEAAKMSIPIDNLIKPEDKALYIICKNYTCLEPIIDRDKIKDVILNL